VNGCSNRSHIRNRYDSETLTFPYGIWSEDDPNIGLSVQDMVHHTLNISRNIDSP
jgi:hypothetical protein